MVERARQPDVERRINEHLEAIDKALAARGVPLIERRSVTGDVEAQIREMLAEQAGENPTLADVDAVLQSLDAPESYAEDAEVAPVEKAPLPQPTEPEFRSFRKRVLTMGLVLCLIGFPIGVALRLPFVWGLSIVGIVVAGVKLAVAQRKPDAAEPYRKIAEASPVATARLTAETEPPRFSRTAIAGAAWAPLLFIFLFLMFFAHSRVTRVYGLSPPEPSALAMLVRFTLIPLGLFAPFGCTILGWLAVSQIRRSNGRLCGLPLALVDGLLFPLLLLDVLIYLSWRVVIAVAYSWKALGIEAVGRPSYSVADQNVMMIFVLAAITSLVVDWLIIRWTWRKVKAPAQE